MYTNAELCLFKELVIVERLLFPFPLCEYVVVVEFQPNSYTINEEDGVVTFIIVKQSQTTEVVEVQFHTQDGSATCKL